MGGKPNIISRSRMPLGILFLLFFSVATYGQSLRRTARGFDMTPPTAQLTTADALEVYKYTQPLPDRPLLGSWQVTDSLWSFRPLGRLVPELSYCVVGGDKILGVLPAAEASKNRATVAIYPQVDSVPENLLKVMLHFSEPMRQGVAIEYLQWTNTQGERLPLPFLDLQPELWDATGTRLTLWLDPGRIKRGLGPNLAQGPPLENGRSYTCTALAGWPTLAGGQVAEPTRQTWIVGLPDRSKLMIAGATLVPPSPKGSTLRLHWPEPLAHSAAQEAFAVYREGKLVPGNGSLSPDGQTWTFLPSSAWEVGTYQLRIAPTVEDLAGNNLLRLFDRDLEQPTVEPEVFTLEFEVEEE